jgi:predicted amidohydrolase YtcJ
MRAAVHQIAADERISARAAFSALTRGAWRLLGHPDRGVLAVGADATFVRWTVPELVVEAPDERISNWSTDPRAATPGLPALGSQQPGFRGVWRHGVEG